MGQTSRQLLLRFWLEVAIFCWQFCEAKSLEQLKDQLCFLEQIEILRPMLNAKGNVRNVECVIMCPGIRMLVLVAGVPHDQRSNRLSFLNDF